MSSALLTLEAGVEKFFKGTGSDVEKFATAFEHLFQKAPSALQALENFTEEVAPVITAVVAIAAPAVEPEVAAALSIAETGLAAIEASAQAANSGQSLLQNLQNFATTVPSLLLGVEVKDPVLKAKITGIVALINGEAKVLIPAVEAWVKQLSATPAAA